MRSSRTATSTEQHMRLMKLRAQSSRIKPEYVKAVGVGTVGVSDRPIRRRGRESKLEAGGWTRESGRKLCTLEREELTHHSREDASQGHESRNGNSQLAYLSAHVGRDIKQVDDTCRQIDERNGQHVPGLSTVTGSSSGVEDGIRTNRHANLEKRAGPSLSVGRRRSAIGSPASTRAAQDIWLGDHYPGALSPGLHPVARKECVILVCVLSSLNTGSWPYGGIRSQRVVLGKRIMALVGEGAVGHEIGVGLREVKVGRL
ncbi:hypothetical protein BDV10DRAFT_74880 [Aspergillus recurvatus]